MMDQRPMGLVLALAGAVGTAIAALADPLGIGEGNVFGWLQITGVIVGGAITLLGLVIASEWMPLPSRRSAESGTSAPQTTIVQDTRRDPST